MEIKNLIIESDLEEYLQSKGDVAKFINFCIRERRDKMDSDWKKPMAIPKEAKDKTKVDAKYRKFLPEDQVLFQNTVFFGKNVCISGVFKRFELRNDLAALLHSYGAAINSNILPKTDIAIFGEGAGPKKREYVKELNASGSSIIIVDEFTLYQMIDMLPKGHF